MVRLRRFSFLRDLIVFWLWLTPLAWLVAAGVIAALRSKSSTLGPRARRGELGLTAVAFSLSIRSHLHLGFAFRPREHLLAQAVHQVAPAGRAARIQRVFLVLPRTSARTTSRVHQQCPSPCSSLSRRKIRWAVWRCFLGRLRSSTRIWSMTPVKGSSLGRRGGVCRR